MEIILGSWLLFGLIGIAIANSKGQRSCLMFILCACLGPIGIVIQIITPKNERRIISKGQMKRCPSCSELVRNTATKCRYCGEPLIYKPTTKSRINPRR
jgi:DNA-directed RNA polymerase subunit RPC12/RpoP